MCWERVSDVGLAESGSAASRVATGDGQLPVKYHDFSLYFCPIFSHISKVPRRINSFKIKICLELEIFQVVTSCRLSCYRSFRRTLCIQLQGPAIQREFLGTITENGGITLSQNFGKSQMIRHNIRGDMNLQQYRCESPKYGVLRIFVARVSRYSSTNLSKFPFELDRLTVQLRPIGLRKT